MYALFHDGIQISKSHSTKEAAMVEAYEHGAVVDYGADFIGDKSGRCLIDGFKIREIDE